MTEPDLAAPPATGGPPASPAPDSASAPISESPDASAEADAEYPEPPATGTGILLVLGLLWLAATMWVAHTSILGNALDVAVALGSAAGALPGVIAASLLAGAAAGLATTSRFAASGGALRRAVVGVAAGALCGFTAAFMILWAYGANTSVAVLAATVVAAGLLGGSAAAMSQPTLAAGLGATLGAFVTGVAFNLFQAPLTSLFGAGETIASRYLAATMVAYTQAGVGGLVAGLSAYWFLRRRGTGLSWPSYLLAGAMAGLLLLVTEGLTRLGGASLLRVVKDLSAADRTFVELNDGARLRNALIVGFVGGIVAMIAVGATLRRPAEPGPAQM